MIEDSNAGFTPPPKMDQEHGPTCVKANPEERYRIQILDPKLDPPFGGLLWPLFGTLGGVLGGARPTLREEPEPPILPDHWVNAL